MEVELLRLDPGLAAAVPPADLERARRTVRVRTCSIGAGPWAGDVPGQPAGEWAGLLVLEGHLVREVELAGGCGAEILGPGDLLRPWDDETAGAPLASTAEWHALTPVRLALLDDAFAGAVGEWPQLAVAVVARLMRRTRCATALLAISHIPRLDPRLLALLWHLADRFGSVESEGVAVPVRLTHRTLGWLIGARRPSVSRSVNRLVAQGFVSARPAGGWWLHGDAAGALASSGNPGYRAASAWTQVGTADVR